MLVFNFKVFSGDKWQHYKPTVWEYADTISHVTHIPGIYTILTDPFQLVFLGAVWGHISNS